MPSPQRPTTTQRGYGWNHQVRRRRAIAEMQDGTPCPLCSLGMFVDQPLDYDHETPIASGGPINGPRRLTHAWCNRRRGGRLGRARDRARRNLAADPGPNPNW